MKKLILIITFGISILTTTAQTDESTNLCGTAIPVEYRQNPSRGYKTFSADLWPNQIIPYTITAGAIPGKLAIEKGISTLNKATNVCLIPKRPTDEAYISFEESRSTVNTSTLGYTDRGTTIKLYVQNGSYEGIVIHEVLHSIGFLHEHQRPDRDDYVHVDISNVQSQWRYAYNKIGGDVLTPYDFTSILHYSPNAFRSDRNKPVMTALNGEKIGSEGKLTELDIAEINHYYPTPLDCDSLYALFPPKPRFTFSYAYSGWCNGYEIRVFNETENEDEHEAYWEIYNGNEIVAQGKDSVFYVPHGVNEIFLTISNEFGSTNTSRTVELEEPDLDLRIYPNPVGENLNFTVEGPIFNFEYSIWDIMGKMLFSQKIPKYNCDDIETVDLSKIGAGVYFIRIESREGAVIKQFLKE